MFVDLRTLEDGKVLDADLCIIGAGPAGITIADRLNDGRRRICLVESGDLQPSEQNQDLADGAMISHRQHRLRTSRDRQFGGSTNSWAGACAPMSSLDFEPRPWLDLDGWPYSMADLEPFYRQAQELFQIGAYNYDPDHWNRDDLPFFDFDADHLENRIWQLSPRANFGRLYEDKFKAADQLTVLLNATATEIIATSSGSAVEAVEVRSLDGKSVKVTAGIIVLAAGAIDNARLLLLSRRQSAAGLGNGHDLVGRYFMQHPHVGAASLRYKGSRHWAQSYKDFKQEDLWLRARIGMTGAAQQRLQTLNPVASVINRYIADSLTHTQSIGYVSMKRVLLDLRRGRVPANFTNEVFRILKDTRGIVIGLLKHLRHQDGALHVMGEQYPNPDSRVTLGRDRDPFGLEKAVVDWQLLPIDKQAIRHLMREIQTEFQRLGVAEVILDEWLKADDHSWPLSLAGGHHHMGTTRMSGSPSQGVVDADAKVHGIGNLYVAGSSIFPTVGCANPTLTLTATSIKLADHLQAQLAKPQDIAV